MGSRALRVAMGQLAGRYQLTCPEEHERFRGLRGGVSVEVSECEEVVTLAFESPSADLGDEAARGFAGFRHCAKAGVPTEWFCAPQERSRQRCLLHVTKRRLDLLGIEKFLEIPELVVRDFHEHGATELVPLEPLDDGIGDGTWVGYAQRPGPREVRIGKEPRQWRPSFKIALLFVVLVLLQVLGLAVWCSPRREMRGRLEQRSGRSDTRSHEQGLRALQKGDYAGALAALDEAIRLEPRNAQAYSLRGEAHNMLGQRQEAISDYTEAIRLLEAGRAQAYVGQLAILYNDRGNTLCETGDTEGAIADCTKAIKLHPSFALAYINRGVAYSAKGLHDQAIADFGEAIRLDRSDFRGFANRARSFLEKRQHDKALPDLTEALRLNPQCAWAWACRADARLHRGEYQLALADAAQAIRLDPKLDMPFVYRFVATASARLKTLGEPRPASPSPTPATRPRSAREPRKAGDEPTPPSPQRVAARAIVLAALVYRSWLDHYADAPGANVLRRRVLDWLAAVGLLSELEEGEREFLATPLGRAAPQAVIDGGWRVEGLVVLAWALKRFELPPHDERAADHLALADAVGFPDDAAAKRLLASAELRPPREIGAFANQITMVSWRLTEYRRDPKAGGFGDVQKHPARCVIEGWLKGVRLVDGDLAIGGRSVAAASDAERGTCGSIARERRIAAYWLEGDDETYSLVSPATMPFITAIFEAQRREPDVAIQVCTKLLELAPQGADWLALRGWAYLRKRDAAKALADLNRAVELKAEAMSHRSRGWVFFHNGDLAAAEADARKALSLNPNDLEPHLLLFRIRAARGERAKAIEEARRLLDALPTGSSGQAVGLLLRYLLGEVPLDTLRNHANWHNFEVVVRGHKQERD